MPGVEVLPNSIAIRAPGWALVPDTGRGPSQVVSQATTKRGRAARASNIGGGDTTARQQNVVLKHLADLDKDSHRDVQIPVPKIDTGRGSKKTTTNVRRILMSQKTFANHLADEEAALAQQQQTPTFAIPRVPPLKSTGSIPNLTRASTSEAHSGLPQRGIVAMGGTTSVLARDPLDDEPLLMVNVPSAPSEQEVQTLLSEPPLSYNASRSDPPPPHKPLRHFCEIYIAPPPTTPVKHACRCHTYPMSLWLSGPTTSLADIQLSVLHRLPFPSNSTTFILFWTFCVTSLIILLLAMRSAQYAPRATYETASLHSRMRLQHFGPTECEDEEKAGVMSKDGYVTVRI